MKKFSEKYLKLTEKAIKKLKNIMEVKNDYHLKLRIYIHGGGCSGFQYQFIFDTLTNKDDIIITQSNVSLIIDPISLQYLNGGEIDYLENLEGSKFVVFNPNAKTTCSCGASFGVFKKNNIYLIQSGIGKVSASIATMILINLYQLDIVINSGSAGSLELSSKIGEIILPKTVCYYDVDLTSFNYDYGQIPTYPKKFTINQKLNKFFQEKDFKKKFMFKTGLIISGDSFIQDNKYIKILKNKFPTAIAVDMESAAIAQVCYKFNIPLIIVKSISDLSNEDATDNFKKYIFIYI